MHDFLINGYNERKPTKFKVEAYYSCVSMNIPELQFMHTAAITIKQTQSWDNLLEACTVRDYPLE